MADRVLFLRFSSLFKHASNPDPLNFPDTYTIIAPMIEASFFRVRVSGHALRDSYPSTVREVVRNPVARKVWQQQRPAYMPPVFLLRMLTVKNSRKGHAARSPAPVISGGSSGPDVFWAMIRSLLIRLPGVAVEPVTIAVGVKRNDVRNTQASVLPNLAKGVVFQSFSQEAA